MGLTLPTQEHKFIEFLIFVHLRFASFLNYKPFFPTNKWVNVYTTFLIYWVYLIVYKITKCQKVQDKFLLSFSI